MLLKNYLIWMIIGTLISWLALFLVLTYLSPTAAGIFNLALFYTSVFLSLSGTITLLGFAWRRLRQRDEVLFHQVSTSFRQGMLVALVVVATLFLQANRLLTWWNLILLIGGLALLEYFMLSVKRPPPTDY